jgi:hypothetical protein
LVVQPVASLYIDYGIPAPSSEIWVYRNVRFTELLRIFSRHSEYQVGFEVLKAVTLKGTVLLRRYDM